MTKDNISISFNVLILKWTATWQNQQNDCAPSEDSDQPGQLPSLIRVFAVRMKKGWILSYPLIAQRRLRSDWADAQADLSLRWAHGHFVGFVMSRLKCLFISASLTDDKHYHGYKRVYISKGNHRETSLIPKSAKVVLLLFLLLASHVHFTSMGNFYLQYQYTLPVFSDKALSLK